MTIEAFDALEAKVQAAVDRMGELAEEKTELERRVNLSELKIAELEPELASSGAERGGAAKDDGAAAWAEEKAELQRRIEKLVQKLEALLEG